MRDQLRSGGGAVGEVQKKTGIMAIADIQTKNQKEAE
jgi:hypothetical protein